MSINLDYLLPEVLTGYVRELPTPPLLTLNRWLPDRNIQDIEAAWDVVTKTNRTAMFRSWDAETPIGKRDSFSRNRIELPPIGQKTVIGERERIMLEQVRTGGDPRNRTIEAIYNEADTNTRAVYNRMELARGDVLTDGKFTLSGENGLTLEVDYGVAADHLIAVGSITAWTDHTNATPLENLRTWADKYIDDTGEAPAYALTSRAVVGHMVQCATVRSALSSLAGVPTQVTRAQLNTLLDAWDLPQLVTYDTQVDVAGSGTRPIAASKVALLPQDPASLGFTAWGITAEALELATGQNPGLAFQDLPGLVGVVLREGDPVRLWTKVTAVGMPVITDPRKLFVASVTA